MYSIDVTQHVKEKSNTKEPPKTNQADFWYSKVISELLNILD